jgi:hypothetical protein
MSKKKHAKLGWHKQRRTKNLLAIAFFLLVGIGIFYQFHTPSQKAVLAAQDSMQMGWFTFEDIKATLTPKPKSQNTTQESPDNPTSPLNPGGNANPASPAKPGTTASSGPACNVENGRTAAGNSSDPYSTACTCPYYLVTCESTGTRISSADEAFILAKNNNGGKNGGGGNNNNNKNKNNNNNNKNNGGGNNNGGSSNNNKNNGGGGNNNNKNKNKNNPTPTPGRVVGRCASVVAGPQAGSLPAATCSAVDGEIGDGARGNQGWCDPRRGLVGNGDGVYCIAKPIIYLYPITPTIVDVKVTFQEGEVYISDPLYDVSFSGWNDVFALPDGTLTYQGKTYDDLFYETTTEHVAPPTNGIIIPSSTLEKDLRTMIYKLGLKGREQDEFMEYWMPTLRELKSPYILASVIEKHEKKRIDNVEITPKPDTFIEFLAYFKPIQYPIAIDPLILPENPPERRGFTAVEWGGTIEVN